MVICECLGHGLIPRGRSRVAHCIMARNKNTQYLDCILTRKVRSKVQKPCRHECALFVWTRVDCWHLPELQYLAIQWSGNNTRDTTCLSLKMNESRPVWVLSSKGSTNNDSTQSIFLPCDIDIHFATHDNYRLFPFADIRVRCGGALPKIFRVADFLSPMLHIFRRMHLILRLTSLVNDSFGSVLSVHTYNVLLGTW